MPRIYVDFAGLKQIKHTCKSVSSGVSDIRSDFQRTVRQLDWDVKFQSNINSTAAQLARKLESYTSALKSYQRFIDDAYDEYRELDRLDTVPCIENGDFEENVKAMNAAVMNINSLLRRRLELKRR